MFRCGRSVGENFAFVTLLIHDVHKLNTWTTQLWGCLHILKSWALLNVILLIALFIVVICLYNWHILLTICKKHWPTCKASCWFKFLVICKNISGLANGVIQMYFLILEKILTTAMQSIWMVRQSQVGEARQPPPCWTQKHLQGPYESVRHQKACQKTCLIKWKMTHWTC